jgi:hypothetical protein
VKSLKTLNRKVLLVFAPILILIGTLGFLLPSTIGLTSGAAQYNIFHITFGIIGLIILFTKRECFIRGFNIGFGVIDLYQALASFLHLFPESVFRWTRGDDILHIVIGAGLIAVGLYGFKSQK